MTKTEVLFDLQDRQIRLTGERREHIMRRPEMRGQFARVAETLSSPQLIIATALDQTVHVYHRYYMVTPVTSKYLLVIVKFLDNDAFLLKAFYSTRQKKGTTLWKV